MSLLRWSLALRDHAGRGTRNESAFVGTRGALDAPRLSLPRERRERGEGGERSEPGGGPFLRCLVLKMPPPLTPPRRALRARGEGNREAERLRTTHRNPLGGGRG